MNTRSGKVYGPAGLFAMSAILIVLLFVGGTGVGLTRGRCREIGLEIRKLESERTDLERDNRSYDELKSKVNDVLSLKVLVKDRLQPLTDDQIRVVRRRPTFNRAAERSVPDDPRFTALDIAFINSAPSRGVAAR